MNYCFVEGCTNMALTHFACNECQDGHWICTSCIEKLGKKQ